MRSLPLVLVIFWFYFLVPYMIINIYVSLDGIDAALAPGNLRIDLDLTINDLLGSRLAIHDRSQARRGMAAVAGSSSRVTKSARLRSIAIWWTG